MGGREQHARVRALMWGNLQLLGLKEALYPGVGLAEDMFARSCNERALLCTLHFLLTGLPSGVGHSLHQHWPVHDRRDQAAFKRASQAAVEALISRGELPRNVFRVAMLTTARGPLTEMFVWRLSLVALEAKCAADGVIVPSPVSGGTASSTHVLHALEALTAGEALAFQEFCQSAMATKALYHKVAKQAVERLSEVRREKDDLMATFAKTERGEGPSLFSETAQTERGRASLKFAAARREFDIAVQATVAKQPKIRALLEGGNTFAVTGSEHDSSETQGLGARVLAAARHVREVAARVPAQPLTENEAHFHGLEMLKEQVGGLGEKSTRLSASMAQWSTGIERDLAALQQDFLNYLEKSAPSSPSGILRPMPATPPSAYISRRALEKT